MLECNYALTRHGIRRKRTGAICHYRSDGQRGCKPILPSRQQSPGHHFGVVDWRCPVCSRNTERISFSKGLRRCPNHVGRLWFVVVSSELRGRRAGRVGMLRFGTTRPWHKRERQSDSPNSNVETGTCASPNPDKSRFRKLAPA